MRIAAHKYEQPMTISQAARAVGYSVDMLRVLERRGVVTPLKFGEQEIRVFLSEHLDQIRQYREQRGRKK